MLSSHQGVLLTCIKQLSTVIRGKCKMKQGEVHQNQSSLTTTKSLNY